ncbi:MAG: hypothetical protein V4573_03670, partial [Pseudomonadota bacterium]
AVAADLQGVAAGAGQGLARHTARGLGRRRQGTLEALATRIPAFDENHGAQTAVSGFGCLNPVIADLIRDPWAH